MTRFMLRTLLAASLAALLGTGAAIAAQDAAQPAIAPAKTEAPVKLNKANVSAMVGMDIGRGLKQVKDEIDLDAVFAAAKATLNDEKAPLTEEEAQQVRQAFMQELQAKRVAEQKAEASENKTAGQAYLAQNKKKSGVKTTADGLQYEVLKAGDGPKPKATDTVKVNYVGTKVDGTKFDSSYDRGEPATFPLNGVIKGWSEGLQLMPVGSKYRFVIPADLAYGENAPPTIGPNATLTFEVELLGIENAGDKAAKTDTKPAEKK